MSGLALQGIVLAVACTAMEGIAQVFLKIASRKRPKLLWTGLGLVMFVLEAVAYTLALQVLDVSVAYPIGALSFVMVTLLSQWWLGEKVDRTRWAGVALIIAGAALVATRA